MRYRYIHFLAALFLIVGMAVQFVTAFVGCLPAKANLPLGFDGKYQFEEQSCELAEGEKLVLYTDGVTEARNSEHVMLGMDRWMEMVARGGNLLEAVRAYIGQAEPTDDITLMTIIRKKSSAQ